MTVFYTNKSSKYKYQVDPVRAMGVDVSTCTGVVILDFDFSLAAWRTVYDDEIAVPYISKPLASRMKNVMYLYEELKKLRESFLPGYIAIEGYGYANPYTLALLVELGTAARQALFRPDMLQALVEVAPSSLKKFVLGKGVGKKEQMILQVFKRWGYEAKTNNLADAYGLAQIAAAMSGPHGGEVKLTKPQTEVLGTLSAKSA